MSQLKETAPLCTTQQWFDAQLNIDVLRWYGPLPRMFLDYGSKRYEFEIYASSSPYEPTSLFLHVLQFKQSINNNEYPDKGRAMHKLFPKTLTGTHLIRWTDYFCFNEEVGEEVTCEVAFNKAVAQCLFAGPLFNSFVAMKLRNYLLSGERFPDEFTIKDAVRSLEDMSNGLAFLTTDVLIQPLNKQELKYALLARLTYKNHLLVPETLLKNGLSFSMESLIHNLEELGCGPHPGKTPKRKTRFSNDSSGVTSPLYAVDKMNTKRAGYNEHSPVRAKKARARSPESQLKGVSYPTNATHSVDSMGRISTDFVPERPRPEETSVTDLFLEITGHPDFWKIAETVEERSAWAEEKNAQLESLRLDTLRDLMYNLIDLQRRFRWTDEETTFILWFGVETMEDFAREEILWDHNIE